MLSRNNFTEDQNWSFACDEGRGLLTFAAYKITERKN